MPSTLRVDQLQTATGANVLITDSSGGITISKSLTLPTWTTATRPTAVAGTIGYNSTTKNVEIYSGTAWTNLTSSADGTSESNSSLSAQAIKAANPSAQSGLYWIKNANMATATQVYCDMSFDSGGWMLLAYGYVNSPSWGSADKNLPNLNHDGSVYTYTPTSRANAHGLVNPQGQQKTAVALTRACTEILFAGGGNPSTGGIDGYTYAYKFNIPNPSAVTFSNHSQDNAAAMTVSTVTVTGLKGESGSWTAYTFTQALGATWSDTYPTGYGAVNSSSVRGWNSNGGPFFPSIHPGSSPRNNGNGWNSSPDVTNGHSTYNYRGWYGKDGGIGVNQTGQTSIWVR